MKQPGYETYWFSASEKHQEGLLVPEAFDADDRMLMLEFLAHQGVEPKLVGVSEKVTDITPELWRSSGENYGSCLLGRFAVSEPTVLIVNPDHEDTRKKSFTNISPEELAIMELAGMEVIRIPSFRNMFRLRSDVVFNDPDQPDGLTQREIIFEVVMSLPAGLPEAIYGLINN